MTFGLPGLASNGSAAPINNIQYLHAPMQGSVSPLQMQQFNTIMSGGQGFQGGISTTGAGPTASMNNLFTQLLQSLNSGQGYSTGGGGGSTSTGTSGGWGHNHGVSSHSHGLPGGGQTFSAGQGTTHGTFGSGGMPGRLDSGVTTINNQFNSQFNLNANLNFSGAQYSHRQAPQFQAPQQPTQAPQQQIPQQLLQQLQQQTFQQPQQSQQVQQVQQEQQPKGLLENLLGPVGGTSSRLFGNVPILGDLLKITSPVALDLNGDGGIGVTGETTAREGQRTGLGNTVAMDLDADGTAEQTEWLKGDGDAMLVDNRDGQALAQGIDGTRLFGDEGGKFNNGYEKLAGLDADQDGQLAGAELQGLQAWIDNGDGMAEAAELVDVADLGLTSMKVGMQNQQNARGEDLMRSSAVINGHEVMTEDVWFGSR